MNSSRRQGVFWRNSHGSIQFLRQFYAAKDPSDVRNAYYRPGASESPSELLDLALAWGLLRPATRAESLGGAYTIAQLRQMAKASGIPSTGAEESIADRLASRIDQSLDGSTNAMVILSDLGKDLLSNWERREQRPASREECLDALRNGQPAKAYDIYLTFMRTYVNSETTGVAIVTVPTVEAVLMARPRVLEPISDPHLRALQEMASMYLIWRDPSLEAAASGLPADWTSGVKTRIKALNYLLSHVRMEEMLGRGKRNTTWVRFRISEADRSSCDLCATMDGQLYRREEFPDLPCVGCTSEEGCRGVPKSVEDDDVVAPDGEGRGMEAGEDSGEVSPEKELEDTLTEIIRGCIEVDGRPLSELEREWDESPAPERVATPAIPDLLRERSIEEHAAHMLECACQHYRTTSADWTWNDDYVVNVYVRKCGYEGTHYKLPRKVWLPLSEAGRLAMEQFIEFRRSYLADEEAQLSGFAEEAARWVSARGKQRITRADLKMFQKERDLRIKQIHEALLRNMTNEVIKRSDSQGSPFPDDEG
jgi:hypothetical protein